MTRKPASKSENESLIERFLVYDMDIEPLVKGIRDEQTAREWLGEANRIDASQKDIDLIVERIQELKSD